jgi:hypothetical protein
MRGVERFSCALLALLLGVALHPAAGQAPDRQSSDSAVVPLTLPIGTTLHCRRLDSASVIQLKLRLGDPPSTTRDIEATFDSLGQARTLLDWGTALTGGTRVETILVRFDSSGAIAYGFHKLDSLASLQDTKTKKRLPPLAAEDSARVKALTAWVWAHRCQSRKA